MSNNLDLKSLLADPNILDVLEAEQDRRARNKIDSLFPDTGPLRRELYDKHMEFFRASKEHDETLFLAANKVGKTVAGGAAATYHSTGLYPHWWEGKRFDHPTVGWACNNTNNDCRDINQLELLGPPGQIGTGLIPADRIIMTRPKPSIPDGIGTAYIRHVTGGQSMIQFKSYDAGRENFQGRNIHWIWPDEEVPDDIYIEMTMRIMVTQGIIFLTYTPILGLTPVTVEFLTTAVNKESLPIKFTGSEKRGISMPGKEGE